MRILFTTTARFGHFHPLVGLARAAKDAGHEVAFACPQSLCAAVQVSGFQVFPTEDDTGDDPQLVAVLERIGRIPAGAPRAAAYLMEVFIGLEARRALPKLVVLGADWKPDLIVREEYELAGAITAEHLEIPHVAVQVTYAANWQQQATVFGDVVSRQLDELRASVGLPSDPTLAMLYRHLLVSFDPPSLLDLNVTMPDGTLYLRPTVFDRSSRDAPPAWLTPQVPRPLVYASFGTVAPTMPNIFPDAYNVLLEGLRDHAGTVVLTVGRDRDPADLGEQPDHVHVERYIPQSSILEQCDLVVTHGGHNTVLAALSLGVPMVILPFFADQFQNAARCETLGVAQVIPGREMTPDRLRTAVRTVLEDDQYRRNATRLKSEIEALPGLEVGVTHLERLVAAHAQNKFVALTRVSA
jgi:UDP:flavonoid glycosyltransferase YjiC (YdhE family)